MNVVRQAGALLLAALVTSRGLFAQGAVDSPATDSTVVDLRGAPAITPADQLKVLLRPVEIRYVQQESVLLPATGSIKGLYVNAWAFGSPKLWQLVRLADETEINAFVVDVKDDTGCLLYPSAVATAQQIGANQCVRAKDARARLDTLNAHGIYPISRKRRPGWASPKCSSTTSASPTSRASEWPPRSSRPIARARRSARPCGATSGCCGTG